MGRHKSRNKHLPTRMRLIAGRYYWVGYRDGKRPTVPLGDDYVTALMKWREIEGHHDHASSVASMLDHFIATHKTESSNTMREYTRLSNRLKVLLKGFEVSDVKPKHVKQLLAAIGKKSEVEANHLVVLLSSAFNKIRGDGIYDGPNPCHGIKRFRKAKRTRKATALERVDVTSGNTVMAVACELYLLIGVRVSDVRLMKLAQLKEEGVEVQPAKTRNSTGATVLFEWTPALRACIAKAKLLRGKRNSEYLFVSRKRINGVHQPYAYMGWYALWRKHKKANGIAWDLQPKDLRRTALAEKKTKEGTDAAKDFAAHGSVTTTEGYLKGAEVVRVRPNK